jgi:hypothetical protein
MAPMCVLLLPEGTIHLTDRRLKTIVNLAEQHGKEGQVTCAYRDLAVELDWADVQYVVFSFG